MNSLLSLKRINWYILLSVICVSLNAQAFYRGDEYEQRDYKVDAEYFLDQLPLLPSIERRLMYRDADDAYWASAGSYTRRELFWMQYLKLDLDLDHDFRFTFDFDMDQDFDNVYEHHIIGLNYDLTEEWSVALIGEPLARKEFADIGLAIQQKTAFGKWRGEFLLPNFEFLNKNDMDGSFKQQPYTIRVYGYQYVTEKAQFFTKFDLDFPSETEYAKPEFDFKFHSYKPSGGFIYDMDERHRIWGEIQTEFTEKNRKSFDQTSPDDFNTDRTYYNARVEYVAHTETSNRYTVGFNYIDLDEKNDYPNDDKKIFNLTHQSEMVYGTWRMPVSGRWFFNTGMYIEILDHVEDYPYNEKEAAKTDGFEGKIPFSLEWIADTYRVEAGLSMQTDKFAFGGGYANAIFVF